MDDNPRPFALMAPPPALPPLPLPATQTTAVTEPPRQSSLSTTLPQPPAATQTTVTATAAAASTSQKRARDEGPRSVGQLTTPTTLAAILANAARRKASRVLYRMPDVSELDELDIWQSFGVGAILGVGSEGVALLARDGARLFVLKVMPNREDWRDRIVGAQEVATNMVLSRSGAPLPHMAHFYGWMRCQDRTLRKRLNEFAQLPRTVGAVWDIDSVMEETEDTGLLLVATEYAGDKRVLELLDELLRARVPTNDPARADLVRMHTLRCTLLQVYAQLHLIRTAAIPDFNHGDLAQNIMTAPEPDFDVYQYEFATENGTDGGASPQQHTYQVPMAALGGRRVVIIDLGQATGSYTALAGDRGRRATRQIGQETVRYDANFWSRWGALPLHTQARMPSAALDDAIRSATFASFRGAMQTASGSTRPEARAGIEEEPDWYRDTVLAHEFFDALRVDPATGMSLVVRMHFPDAKSVEQLRVRRVIAFAAGPEAVKLVKHEMKE